MDPQARASVFAELAGRCPHIAEISGSCGHDEGSVVGPDCDDQFEFEFALALLLDGFGRLHRQAWTYGGNRSGGDDGRSRS